MFTQIGSKSQNMVHLKIKICLHTLTNLYKLETMTVCTYTITLVRNKTFNIDIQHSFGSSTHKGILKITKLRSISTDLLVIVEYQNIDLYMILKTMTICI